jgi:signal transduction histidine kinase
MAWKHVEGKAHLAHLEEVHHLATQGSMEVRRAIFALTRSVREEGLCYVLRTLVEESEANTGIETCLVMPPGLALPHTRAYAVVMRVVQEALSNVRKHGQATMVLVNLAASDDTLTVTVQDNGIGMPVADLPRTRSSCSPTSPIRPTHRPPW